MTQIQDSVEFERHGECDLPEGWEEHLDLSTGAVYYHHASSMTTQWERPEKLQVVGDDHNQVMSGALLGKQGQFTLAPLSNITHKQQQLTKESGTSKRTTVKIKSKRLHGIIQSSSSNTRVHVLEDGEGTSTQHSTSPSTSPSPQAQLDPPVGGKSQDYVGLAQIHKLQRPYADRTHTLCCVLCERVVPMDVFFPCEHRVVCRGCLHREQVCPDYDMGKFPAGHCTCPLCAAVIKLILPSEGGLEVEKYWEWVLAVKPELPQGFMRDFRHSAAIIQKIHIDENERLRRRKARGGGWQECCSVS